MHWYSRDTRHKAGFKRRCLHQLEPLSPANPDAFGFLDPNDVIRSAHLIPAFAHRAEEGSTLPSVTGGRKKAWSFYYVNWYVFYWGAKETKLWANDCVSFVDRDMYMLF